jgi:protein transport protein SEC24
MHFLRVHTLAVPVVNDLSDLYNGADAAALICITAKMAVEKALLSKLEETRQMVQSKVRFMTAGTGSCGGN